MEKAVKKVLLLNLPSRIPCYRILHRAKIGDPNYIWPLVDFVCLSGYLHEAGFTVEHKDFQTDTRGSLDKFLKGKAYDAVIATYCPFFEEDDLKLLSGVKRALPGASLILLADHKDRLDAAHKESILRGNSFIDALVYDYAYNNVAAFIAGERGEALFNVFYMDNGALKGRMEPIPREFSLPVPRHELFASDSYFHYDSVGGLMTASMSTFGCKMGCAFCWAPQLYPTISARTPENMIAEMEYIVKCGISEVYFHDFSFAIDRKQVLRFCELMVEKKIKLRWFCSSRFDLMSPEVIEAMAKAGCRCIEFGLESGNYEVRKLYGKPFPDSKVREVLALCDRHGIHKSAFVILGLPEESLDDMKKSLKFVRSAGFDFIALNVLWAERFTDIAEKLSGDIQTDNSSEAMKSINFSHPHVSNKELVKLYRSSMMSIYLNPVFLFRQIAGLRSFKKLRIALYLVRKLFFRKSSLNA